MRRIEYDYDYCPTIRQFSNSDIFLRGLMGPFGSGKSSGCVIEIVNRAHQMPPGPDGIRRSRWVVVRNTYPQLRDTTMKTFLDWLPSNYFGRLNKADHEYIVDRFPGVHLEVLFRALDRPEHVSNLLSLELTGVWVNEAREVPASIIDALQGRVGRYPARRDVGQYWYGVIMDTNPPDEDSWWYRLFEEQRPDNAALFRQPSGLCESAENRKNLPSRYYENLAEGKDPEFTRVYIHGEYGFVMDGKPVYPEYNDSVHCQEVEPTPKKPIRRGWDFGLTPACTMTQFIGGRWIAFDEVIGEDMGIERFADQVIAHCGEYYPQYEFEDIGDPAGESRSQTDEKTCFQILRAKGIDIRAGLQSEAIRLESVKKALNTMVDGKPGLVVSPRCKMLRKGFLGGYHYRRIQTAREKYHDHPEKNEFSHPHDALQYDATLLFGAQMTKKQKSDFNRPVQPDLRFVR